MDAHILSTPAAGRGSLSVFIVPRQPQASELWLRLRRILSPAAQLEVLRYLPIRPATNKVDLLSLQPPDVGPEHAQRLQQQQQGLLDRYARWRTAAYRYLGRRDPLRAICIPFCWAGVMHATKSSWL